MKFLDLKNLANKNEIRIDNVKGYSMKPPHFYESLRNGFSAWFNTFRTNNSSYETYAQATSENKKANLRILETQFLDIEHTVSTIINLERFFELFIKDLLRKTHYRLVQQETSSKEKNEKKSKHTWELINRISSRNFFPHKPGGKIYTIAFRESLQRFYELVRYTKIKEKASHPIVKKFSTVLSDYSFLSDDKHKSTLEFINWYRDRILHNGNKLPSMRLLDFIMTDRISPIIREIRLRTKKEFNDWWFFLETRSGINILDLLAEVELKYRNPRNKKQIREAFLTLVYVGHLKELGRANLNMNWLMRGNLRATYEYNYQDPMGRGKRFALVEKEQHLHAKKIKVCPCCSEKSMVLYTQTIDDIFTEGGIINIDWIKCYTCDYYLRYNTGDPYKFGLHKEPLFI